MKPINLVEVVGPHCDLRGDRLDIYMNLFTRNLQEAIDAPVPPVEVFIGLGDHAQRARVSVAGVASLVAKTTWYQLQKAVPLTLENCIQQPFKIEQLIKWSPSSGGSWHAEWRMADTGDLFACSVKAKEVPEDHYLWLDANDPSLPISPIAFVTEGEDMSSPRTSIATSGLEYMYRLVLELLPYRGDHLESRRRYTTLSQGVLGLRRLQEQAPQVSGLMQDPTGSLSVLIRSNRSQWYNRARRVSIKRIGDNSRVVRFHVAHGKPIPLGINIPPTIPETLEEPICQLVNRLFRRSARGHERGNYFVALQEMVRILASMEATEMSGDGIESLQHMAQDLELQELSDPLSDPPYQDGARYANEPGQEVAAPDRMGVNERNSGDNWSRPPSTPAELWDRARNACQADRATVRQAGLASTLSYQGPTDLLSKIQDYPREGLTNRLLDPFASNRGLRPSLDANHLVMVTPVGTRYIHHQDNVNVVPTFANLTKHCYPTSVFLRLFKQCRLAEPVSARPGAQGQSETLRPLDLKQLELRPRPRSDDEADAIDANQVILRKVSNEAAAIVPYERVKRGKVSVRSDNLLRVCLRFRWARKVC